MSFSDVRESLVISLADGILSDEEFALLYPFFCSENPCYPYWDYDLFTLDNFDSSECFSDFRVFKEDLPLLLRSLQVPNQFRCRQGTICSGIEGLCMLLKRLAYPCRYFDMIRLFGRPVPELCMLSNVVLDWFYNTHGHRLTSWNQPILSPPFLESYCQAISRMGSPLTNCFGFVDGTVRPIARPGENQRLVYNGHKRVHSLKFQSVAIPNGLISNLYGPVEGRRHDSGMLAESNLLTALTTYAYDTAGNGLCIYGDLAYPLRPQLMTPYRQNDYPVFTQNMQDFNTAMSGVRISVEWLFGDISTYFKFIDYKNNLRIGLSAVGKQYIISGLMRNALTCLYGNNTSQYFQLDPPTLQNYFL